MLFGAAYYPEYQSHDRSERDVALMGKAGFGYVRLRESTWHLREPADGDFLVDWIERVVDRCHAARLATVLGTPTYAVPAWLVRRYPEILAHSAIGRPVHLGARQNIDIGRGAYLFHAERMIRAAVGHFAAHPGVSGFQIDSETGVHLLHNPDTHQRFADWLRRRYGTVDAVNRAWGTNHWSLGLADWAGLWPADHNSSPGYDIDRRRFQTALTCQFLNWQHGIVREAARPDQFTTHCCVGGHAAIRPAGESRRTARIVDRPAVNVCYSTPASLSLPDPRCRASRQDPDPVPTWSAGDGVWTLYLQADFARVDERGFLVRESNASNAGHPHENQPSSPGQLRQAAYAMAARGARGIGYWHWHSYTGKEIYRRGIPGHDYEPGDRYEVAQLGAELRALGPLLDEPEPDSEVAVWLATGSDYALEFLPPQMSIVDEATPSGELDRHRVLIVPAAYAVSDEVAGRLVDYAARGGHLVLTFRSGYADEHARAREITAPGPFAAAAGIRYRDYGNVRGTIAVTSLRTDLDVSGGRATAWADYVEPVDAEVVLHYQAAHLRDYAAATTRVHGAGRVTWIGTLPDPELARRCAAVAGLWPPPPGLAPQVRADSASRTDGRTKALLPGELARPDRRGQCAVPGRPARGLRASSARGRKRTAPESRCTSRPERCSCSIAPAPFNRPGDLACET
jgi:beta-galactosidase